MIVSASRRTDLPAFFGEWFIRRVREGFFHSINPFNPANVKRFSLLPEEVDCIVFWTKNPAPFMKYLEELDDRGYRYYFQYTLNSYPAQFELNVPPLDERIESFQRLGERLGLGRVVWRYDPIIISSVTPVEYHIEQLARIAEKLENCAERLVISFMDYYGKVDGRLKKLQELQGIRFVDITAPEGRDSLYELCKQIKAVASRHGMQIYSCAEALDLQSVGVAHGSCIDGSLIRRLFHMEKEFPRDRNQRKECLCAQSVDMGVYNTCRLQCCYCYANFSEKSILGNLKRHSADSPCLIDKTRV